MNKKLPRGLHNHNPGNIRHDNEKWIGEVQPSTDPDFKQFVSNAYGYRAMLKLITGYITRYGCTTVRRLIARWAPPSVCNTTVYVDYVCRNSRIDPDEPLNPSEERQMCKLAAGMSQFENGIFPRIEDITAGWNLLKEK